MGNDGKGKGGMGKGKGSAGRGKSETTNETNRRATALTRQLVDFAVAGFPPFEQFKARVAQFYAQVDKKLGAVPRERRTLPPATINAPAAFQYALLGESDEVADLREMFENLLVASMDRDTAASAHPAFVSMISQLTPDEARILTSIDRDDYALVNVYEFARGIRRLIATRTRLGIGVGIDEARQQQYLSNLDRLGILHFSTVSSSNTAEHNALATLSVELVNRGAIPSNESILVTPLGRQFLDTCVRAR